MVVGRGLADGVVEVRPRRAGPDGPAAEQVPVADAPDRIAELVDGLLAG